MDVLDLVISTLKEYEAEQHRIVERLKAMEEQLQGILDRHLKLLKVITKELKTDKIQ